jgi:proline iminopeptidase
VLIHGRDDLSSPLAVPVELARAWPGSELVVVDREGHRGGTRTEAAIVAALSGLAAYR